MKIFVFSPEFETLGLISNFLSLRHVTQFAGSGAFVLKAPFSDKLFRLLSEDNILYWTEKSKSYAVYVDSVVCETDRKEEFISASGKNLRGLLSRRIVWNNMNFSGTVEDFALRVVTENCMSASRAIPFLALSPRKGLPQIIARQTSNENLEELLDDVTAASGVGFDIAADPKSKQLIFSAYIGVDYRTTQKTNPWLIISRDRNNVLTETYTRSEASFRNTALIAGKIDETTGVRPEEYIENGSGLKRREIFVDGSSINLKAQDGETEEQAAGRYKNEMLQIGVEKLAAQVNVLSLDCEVDSNTLDRVNVGDKVTVIETAYNLTAQTYISEITTYYEGGGSTFDITLGDSVPTVYKKISKGVR